MKKGIFGTVALMCCIMMTSCNQNREQSGGAQSQAQGAQTVNMEGASTIVYNVFLKPNDMRDPYAPELYANFDRDAFVEEIFDAVMHHRATVTTIDDKPMSLDDIKTMEIEDPAYSRDKLAGIQFTEDWKLDAETMQMNKKVRSMLVGYEVVVDSVIDHLRPGFKIHFE